ncbi:MAG: LptF/LptG family permease [Myxococcaceae bacterium]
MKARIERYVLSTFVTYLGGVFSAVLGIYLVADYVDRAKAYTGPTWIRDVLELYGYKTLVTAHQLAPAALLLAAGASISTLRKRGELTALRSLGFGPVRLCLPIALCALLCCGGLVFFEDAVVSHASRRVDEIARFRFNRWGDWETFFSRRKWFRRGQWVFYLRDGDAQEGFAQVTLLELSPDFQLARRVDAASMRFTSGTTWQLTNVAERRFFGPAKSELVQSPSLSLELGAPDAAFRIRSGRPEQLRIPQLREQIKIRKAAGLSVVLHVLALHNRFAYPLAGLPACLLAVALALRTSRKGHLTAALVEGLTVALMFWGTMVICRALAVGGQLSPSLAAWTPMALLSIAALTLLARQEWGPRRYLP